MFDFKNAIKTWSTSNTDVEYLKQKDELLTDLTKIKDRVIGVICEIDEDINNNYRNLNNLLNAPFTPKDYNNYDKELEEHFKILRMFQNQFENLVIRTINNILKENSYRTKIIKSTLTKENIRIMECKNKYSEASLMILLSKGQDIYTIDEQAEQVLAVFHSSNEYLNVLYRKTLEENYKAKKGRGLI